MRKSGRLGARNINYRIFHSTGEKVDKDIEQQDISNQSTNDIVELLSLLDNCSIEDSTMSKANSMMNQLLVEESVIAEDITDHIDENPVQDLCDSIEDLDVSVNKMEELRSRYRGKHKELQFSIGDDYEPKIVKSYERMMTVMKTYIKDAKEAKRKIRKGEDDSKKEEKEMKEESINFLITDVRRSITDLTSEFKKDMNDVEDQELQRRKSDLAENMKRLENVSEKCKEIIMFPSKNEDVICGMKDVRERYENLLSLRDIYVDQLKKEISERELDKHDLFNEAHLNIKIAKFTGYESQTDVYTFQCDFEKLYLRTTPKRMLPDLLKNNFLGEPALSLVKNEEDITEIWQRLKMAYGDPKTLLSRKIADVSKFDTLWKTNDPEKLIAGLSKIINTMKDLLKISKRHNYGTP